MFWQELTNRESCGTDHTKGLGVIVLSVQETSTILPINESVLKIVYYDNDRFLQEIQHRV